LEGDVSVTEWTSNIFGFFSSYFFLSFWFLENKIKIVKSREKRKEKDNIETRRAVLTPTTLMLAHHHVILPRCLVLISCWSLPTAPAPQSLVVPKFLLLLLLLLLLL
jgi:hypothetical protein